MEKFSENTTACKIFDDGDLFAVFICVCPEYIVHLKFILESYEGLGILRTLDVEKNQVVILSPFSRRKDLLALICDIQDEYKLEPWTSLLET